MSNIKITQSEEEEHLEMCPFTHILWLYFIIMTKSQLQSLNEKLFTIISPRIQSFSFNISTTSCIILLM